MLKDKTFILNSYLIFKDKTTKKDAFRLMVRADGAQNKLYIDRVLTNKAFKGNENVDWEVIEVIYSPAELGALGKFVIGAKEYDEVPYFIWAELLTEIGIMGETDVDYNLIVRER